MKTGIWRQSLFLPVLGGGLALVALGSLLVISLLALAVTPAPGPAAIARSQPAADGLPLAFVPNVGQSDPEVKYQVHDMASTLFFTEDRIVLALAEDTLDVQFEGASATLRAAERAPGVVNYLRGDDPAAWQTGVPTYNGLIYEALYPGIDLRYDGASGRLKATYTVAPGADPGLIRWRHTGAASAHLDEATGDLQLTLSRSGRTLIEAAPIAWQLIGGRQRPVPIRFALAADGGVGFELPQGYDTTRELIIDPTIVYSTFLGGASWDAVADIAVDADGNVYLTGSTGSSDFPKKNALYGVRPGGDEDAFILKLNAAGTALVYGTFLGGDDDDGANGLAVDAQGNVYVAGETSSEDYPTTASALQDGLSSQSGFLWHGFLTKLNAAGSALAYSTYLGSAGSEDVSEAADVAVTGAGLAYVVGGTFAADFPVKNAHQADLAGDQDAFVVKLDTTKSGAASLLFGTYLGGSRGDEADGAAVDGSGNVYLVGATASSLFTSLQAAGGTVDAFAAKLTPAGALAYGARLGGSANDYGNGIAVDGAGGAFLVGNTTSTNFPTTAGAFQRTFGNSLCPGVALTPNVCNDVFVARLNAAGNGLVFSTLLGGYGNDYGYGIAVAGGQAYVVGSTDSNNFPIDNYLQAYGGNGDAFVAKLSADGSALDYSTFLGGGYSDAASSVAVHGPDAVYVGGYTSSGDFPVKDAFQAVSRGMLEGFLVKLSDAGAGTPAPSVTPPPPTQTPPPTPTGRPGLTGSFKSAEPRLIGPDDQVTFTIHLINSAAEDATADVVDVLPAELDYVPGSADPAATYNAAQNKLTWNDIAVPAGSQVRLTFQAEPAVTVDRPISVENTVAISSGGATFTRSAAVGLLPAPPAGDVRPPHVLDVAIGESDLLTSRDVVLHITAEDNVGVTKMAIREWQLATRPYPRWELVRETPWIDFQKDYAWRLGDADGTHIVAVWVKDAAGNKSRLDRRSLDYASLIRPGADVPAGGLVPYLAHFEAGVTVNVTLTPNSGDPDLYVWYPGGLGQPDKKSTNDTGVDAVTFTTPRAGAYLILVHGYSAANYDLAVTVTGALAAQFETQAVQKVDTLQSEPVLVQAGLDPLGEAQAVLPPQESFTVFLPAIRR